MLIERAPRPAKEDEGGLAIGKNHNPFLTYHPFRVNGINRASLLKMRKLRAAKSRVTLNPLRRQLEFSRLLKKAEEAIQAKNYTEARECLEKIGTNNFPIPPFPETYRYHYLLGMTFFWQGNHLSAWKETTRALQIFNKIHRLPPLPEQESLPDFVAKILKQLRAIEVALLEGLEGRSLDETGQKWKLLERRVFEISASLKNLNPLAKLHLLAGNTLRHLGKLTEALEHLEWAATGFRLSRDWALLAETLNGISMVHYSQGELRTAIQILEQARTYSLKAKNHYFELVLRSNIAICHLWAGNWRPLLTSLPEILTTTKKSNDFPRYVTVLLLSGQASLLQGRLKESRKTFLEAHRICTEKKLVGLLKHCNVYLADLEMAEGRWEEAEGHLKKVLEISQQVSPQGDPVAEAWQKLVEVFAARKEYDQAAKTFTLCREHLAKWPEKLVEGALYRGMGVCRIGMEQLRLAQSDFKKAIDIFESCGSDWELAKTVVIAAENGAFAPAEIQPRIILAREIFKKLEHPAWSKRARALLEHSETFPTSSSLRLSHEWIEKEKIARALAEANGNISVAAKKLGLLRQTLQYKIKRYKIEP